MTDQHDPHDESDLAAAEYAAGLLDPREMAEADERLARDIEFSMRVAAWQERLEPLLGDIEDREPAEDVWPRIEAELDTSKRAKAPTEAANDTFGGSNVVQLRKRVSVWRGYSAAMTAVAACLALAVGLDLIKQDPPSTTQSPSTDAPRPMLIASIAPEAGPLTVTASYDEATGSLIIVPASLESATGKDHELWVVPASGDPRSLGLVQAGAPQRHAVQADVAALLREKATLAISSEPSGGSPTGLPTGPIVATGSLATI